MWVLLMSQTASNNSGKGVSHLKHATTDFAPCIFKKRASPSAQHARAPLLIKTRSALEIASKMFILIMVVLSYVLLKNPPVCSRELASAKLKLKPATITKRTGCTHDFRSHSLTLTTQQKTTFRVYSLFKSRIRNIRSQHTSKYTNYTNMSLPSENLLADVSLFYFS